MLDKSDVLSAVPEKIFWDVSCISSLFIVVFRLANRDKEEDLAISMTQHTSCTPQHLNIPGPLCLEADFPTQYSFPYQQAVQELQRIKTLVCPLAKLQCIGILF